MERTRYTPAEEIANSVTHTVWLAASVAASALLIVLVCVHGDGWWIVGSCVYGASLVALYTASTLYHVFRRPGAKRLFRTLDHCAIYLLIAGTYTPFVLVGLRGGWGWTLFGVAWGLCVAGIVFKMFFTGRLGALSSAVYVTRVGCAWWPSSPWRRCSRGVCSPGWLPEESSTPRGPPSTTTAEYPTLTPSGTCLSWRERPATTLRSSNMFSVRGVESGSR